jgi:hypothetical protein
MICKNRKTLVYPIDILIKRIDGIDIQIYNLSKIIVKNQTIQYEWEINRLNWYKNRYVFYFLFIFKNIPKTTLSYLCSLKKLDYRLIKIWKNLEFRNLCTYDLISIKNSNKKLNLLCRIPLFFRKFTSVFYTQKSTGCICCATIYGINEPIWWDDVKKIRIISNLKIFEKNMKITLISCINVINFLKSNESLKPTYILQNLNFSYELKKKEIDLLLDQMICFTIYITVNDNKKDEVKEKVYEYILINIKIIKMLF